MKGGHCETPCKNRKRAAKIPQRNQRLLLYYMLLEYLSQPKGLLPVYIRWGRQTIKSGQKANL